ncbi:MAG: 2-isopropylmalate synthase [Chloroflexi bacterium]|nr:2-isopropylmalate synthase [Chloroflexota bacterium]
MADEHVYIFDTTLRDGEQAPGATMNADEKLRIARQLERMGVDIIEAGFGANSEYEVEAIQRIAREVRTPIITSLARAVAGDVDAAWRAVQHAARPRIHVFLSTSDIHMMHQMRRNKDEIMEMAIKGVQRAKQYVEDVEFSPMDATRTEPEYLYELLEAVIQAGATTINVPDTVGYAIPEEFEKLIRSVFTRVPSIGKARVSVHCHNDLGLSTANSLAAVRAGARQIEVCINGIGERAGNASLEEVVMGLRTRRDLFGIDSLIDTTQITRASRLVSDITGMVVQPNKAIVGANTTFEIIDPVDVGVTSTLHLGKTSGRAGFRSALKDLGYDLNEEDFMQAWDNFKNVVNTQKVIEDEDVEAIIEAIVSERQREKTEDIYYAVEQVQVVAGDPGVPTASVRLRCPDGEVRSHSAIGNGPVDAIYKAISGIVTEPHVLAEFLVKAITESTDSMGDVTIRISSEGHTFTGRGVSTDILVAAAKAHVNALNRMMAARSRKSIETPR